MCVGSKMYIARIEIHLYGLVDTLGNQLLIFGVGQSKISQDEVVPNRIGPVFLGSRRSFVRWLVCSLLFCCLSPKMLFLNGGATQLSSRSKVALIIPKYENRD